MIDDLIAQLDALGEEEFYYFPATTKAKINEAKAALKSQAARIAKLEAALANARRDGMEAAAKWHDEQAAKAQRLSDMKVSAEDEEVWGDYAENHREYAAEIRAALEGGKDE